MSESNYLSTGNWQHDGTRRRTIPRYYGSHLPPLPTKFFVYEQKTSLSRLFTLLYLPSFNCIGFYTAIEPTHHSNISLLSLLTHFHNTTQLFIDTGLFTRQDFIKCLRICPLLKSLYIRKPSTYLYLLSSNPAVTRIDDAFLKLFIESSNDEGYLCPYLEDFESS